MTVFVAGDVSGHVGVFGDVVRAAGGDPGAGWIPEDVVLVHTGDLVHKGPSSAACVDLALRLLGRSPGRFLSIWGNHDAHYVAGAPSVAGRRLVAPVDDTTAATLRRWWNDAVLPLAVAVDGTDGAQWLISHAGLTAGRWAELGRPATAAVAARALNGLVGRAPAEAFRPGCLVTGITNRAAGSCWAETVHELLAPWLAHSAAGGAVPFHQVHGHASVVGSWPASGPPQLRLDTPPQVAAAVRLDPANRRYQADVGGQRFVGVDWIMLADPVPALTPLLRIDAARIVR